VNVLDLRLPLLLLETDALVARAALRRLRQLGRCVVVARDVAEVIDLSRETLFDAAILEFEVGGATPALEAARLLRARQPGLPIVFQGCHGSPKRRAEAAAMGLLVERAAPIDETLAALRSARC